MNYIVIYRKYQKSKSDRYSHQTKTIPMLIGSYPFEEIVIDFLGELPDSKEFNIILVINDCFTKIQYYIPTRTNWTLADMVNTYINYIWELYRLPNYIMLDCRPQFTSLFMKEVKKKLHIRLCLSTAHHPQIDRLSKYAIHILKQYIYIFCYNR